MHDHVPIAPAERYDLVVDFGAYPVGTEVTLVNRLGAGGTAHVMRFRVTRRATEDSLHHPIHLHLVHFRVLSRGGHEPGPFDVGIKDTVDLRPGEAVEVIARFDGYRGRYMFHCHNVEHEDMGMMANFETI